MRKTFLSLFLIFTLLVTMPACGKKDDVTLPTDATEATEATEADTAFDGALTAIGTDERAFAVMIDNDGDSSRPHAGLEDAYIVYEMYVEGSATRLMAIYKGADTEKIGPVRSSRHYFLDYVLDNDALYSHAGFSPLAMTQIGTMNVDNMNGLVYEPTYYWRERKFRGDYHSLFTSTEKLNSLADTLGYRKTSPVLPFNFSTNPPIYDGVSATEISIPYAGFYKVSYTYNPSEGVYERYINSQLHPTQSGKKLTAGQIVFQFAKNYSLGDGSDRQQLDTVGTGEGIYITDGVQIPITWSRASRTEPLRLFTTDGNELVLDAAKQTYVQVMPASLNYSVK